MKKILHFIYATTILFTVFSCEKEETIKEEFSFTYINIDKPHSFIGDDPATIIIDAKGYTNISITSSNDKITITKKTDNAYLISATEITSGNIVVSAIDENNNITKDVDVSFYEHGTKDYKTVEGIKIDEDTTTELYKIHGAAEQKSTFTSGGNDYENWYYLSKGIRFTVFKSTNKVDYVTLYGPDNKSIIRLNNTNYTYKYTTYKHEIDGLGKFTDDNGILMKKVVDKYGTVATENKYSYVSPSELKIYKYADLNTSVDGLDTGYFYFKSDNIDNYSLQKIEYIQIY